MVSGASIRLVCAEVRALLTEQAALRLNCAPEDLDITEGAFVKDGGTTGLDYWDVAPALDFSQAPTGAAAPKSPADYNVVGQDIPRADLPGKVTGAAETYLHDIQPDGALHARTLRQPGPRAILDALDEDAVRHASGDPDLRIVRRRNGNVISITKGELTQNASGAGLICIQPRLRFCRGGAHLPADRVATKHRADMFLHVVGYRHRQVDVGERNVVPL